MRRRTRSGFAWVSMMDLLFALFGGLIVLTVLISTKLGAVSPIDERRFHAVTLEVAARDPVSGEALSRTSIKFVLFVNGQEPCQFGASTPASNCLSELGDGYGHEQRLTEFATAAEAAQGSRGARVTATLLITEPREEGALDRLAILPVLGNIAQLRDRSKIDPNAEFDLRMSVKSQRAVWELRNLTVSVNDLLNEYGRMSDFGARLLPPDIATKIGPVGGANCTGDCGDVEWKRGGKLVLAWR